MECSFCHGAKVVRRVCEYCQGDGCVWCNNSGERDKPCEHCRGTGVEPPPVPPATPSAPPVGG